MYTPPNCISVALQETHAIQRIPNIINSFTCTINLLRTYVLSKVELNLAYRILRPTRADPCLRDAPKKPL